MPAIFQIIISSLATTLLCGLVVAPVLGRPSKALQLSETFLSVPFATIHFQRSSDPEQNDLLQNEDHVPEDVNINVRRRRQAIKDKSKLWPGGVVPYVLEKTQADKQTIRDTVEAAMRQVEQSVGSKSHPCVQFVPRTTQVNYLNVRLGRKCFSFTGLINAGPQELTLAPACVHRKGKIMHELLHALGLYNEQNRYDRDKFVDINSNNIMEEDSIKYDLKNKNEIDTLNTTYDFTSIMHYGPYYFAKDQRWPVMTPKKRYSSGLWMGQRHALSHLDVLRIQRLYHCPEDTSHILSDSSMDKRLFWCDFENGTCTFVVSSNSADQGASNGRYRRGGVSSTARDSQSLWMITSKPTPDGPTAGSTNGLDPFFYASRQRDKVSMSQKKKGTKTSDPSVALKTPVITIDTASICFESKVFQPSPSSYLEVYVMGPLVTRKLIFSTVKGYQNGWVPVRTAINNIPPGSKIQFELVLVLGHGSVSLDDIHILKGSCQ